MENALKGLLMAAATVITCTIIAFGFYAVDLAKNNASAGYEALNSYGNRLSENNYLIYDGAMISGSELINLLRYELSKNNTNASLAYFEVVNSGSKRLSKAEDVKELVNKNSSMYVLPEKAYRGTAIWESGCLVALKFTQE